MATIDRFDGEHEFLSNFFPCEIHFEGRTYPSTEHAFQAAKTLDEAERQQVQNTPTAGRAKRLGKKVTLRKGWEGMRVQVMLEICRLKFQDPRLAEMLLATGDAELVEGNSWNDTFWGVCRGHGKNHLGQVLMQIRGELRGERNII